MPSRRDEIRVGACLSLSGRYARFGRQAANALDVWQSFHGKARLIIKDDESDPKQLATLLPQLSEQTDILLGPYSTHLMKHAAPIAVENDLLLWNHGGSGDDDVETGFPGHVVSIVTPTGQYAEPFVRYLASSDLEPAPLWIVEGRGSFGRQVADGAESSAKAHDTRTKRTDAAKLHNCVPTPVHWDMSAGTFENDVKTITRARHLDNPPRTICAVAAEVQDFANEVDDPDGTFGVGQWFRHPATEPELGPSSGTFLAKYADAFGTSNPDYPAIQATAAAVVGTHCVREAGTTTREALWSVVAALKTSTPFGDFGVDPGTGMQLGQGNIDPLDRKRFRNGPDVIHRVWA